jgi:hypothetical protein
MEFLSKEDFKMEIKRVGIVGMGTMGSQIGIVCASGGFQTTMVDVSKELIGKYIKSKIGPLILSCFIVLFMLNGLIFLVLLVKKTPVLYLSENCNLL